MDANDFQVLANLWLGHVATAALVVAPVAWFTRRRVRWSRWELQAFILPFAVWFGLMYTGARPKSLANLGEYIIISAAIWVAAVLRATLPGVRNSWIVPTVLVALIVVAAATYFLVPAWPE